MLIVAQTDSKYGMNMSTGIYLFYFRLYFNVKITMKHPVTNEHIFLRKHYVIAIYV